jgi:acetyl esterase/lipase
MRFVLLAAALAILAAPALAATPASDVPSAIWRDPPKDPAAPASGMGVQIESGGQLMNGMLYRAAGKGPHPVVVLAHGLPGNEQNLDLAQAMRRAGWTVVTYHYRGSWGSQGSFSFENQLADLQAVVAWLHRPEIAAAWGVDPTRVVVMGHSMGAFSAANAGADLHEVMGIALIAPMDPSLIAPRVKTLDPATRDAMAVKRFDDVDGRLVGADAKSIMAAIADRGERFSLAALAPRLADRPVFVATATHDNDSSRGLALLPALKAANAGKLTAVEMDTDHSFNDHRIALEIAVLKWLATLPGAPPLD